LSFDSQKQQEQEDPEDIIQRKHKRWRIRRQMVSKLEAASMREVESASYSDDNNNGTDTTGTNSATSSYTATTATKKQEEHQHHHDNNRRRQQQLNTNVLSTGSSYTTSTNTSSSYGETAAYDHNHINDSPNIYYADTSFDDNLSNVHPISNTNISKDNNNASANSNKSGIRDAHYYRNRREQQRIELELSQQKNNKSNSTNKNNFNFKNHDKAASNSSDCNIVGTSIVSLPIVVLRNFMSKTCGDIDEISSDDNEYEAKTLSPDEDIEDY